MGEIKDTDKINEGYDYRYIKVIGCSYCPFLYGLATDPNGCRWCKLQSKIGNMKFIDANKTPTENGCPLPGIGHFMPVA
ncbi:hypothetical protein M0R19_07990 [Candidatus Pacearchaeota archaeon]|nr:hypothetical protein [Candidatus Pacearchaeota archaeon]